MCLLYYREDALGELSKSASDSLLAASCAYDDDLRETGHYIASSVLQPAGTGSMLRVWRGQVTVMERPVSVGEEQLGGFLLVEAGDLNDAIRIGAKSPLARLGHVEVRLVKEIPRER
jgi:hypothetical protein